MNIGMKIAVALSCVALLQGCHHDDDDDDQPLSLMDFSVMTTNLTNNQPLSPLALALHGESELLNVGMSASKGLEHMAEGGDNTLLLEEFVLNERVDTTASGTGLIMPGDYETLMLTTSLSDVHLSLSSMLVNSNDGFVAVDGAALNELKVGESLTLYAPVYDAGTEANSESMATIPGPAAGGEGYNSERDDRDFVSIHPGILTETSGLVDSVLNSGHRFDNPAAKVVVTRLQ